MPFINNDREKTIKSFKQSGDKMKTLILSILLGITINQASATFPMGIGSEQEKN